VSWHNAQNPLLTFPRNFAVDGEVAKCWQQVTVIEFRKRHNTTDTTDFCLCQLDTDLSFMLRTCYGKVANLLQTCYGKTDILDFGLNGASSLLG